MQGDQHEGAVAGAPRAEGEAPVRLLEDQGVVRRFGAELMAPQLVRTHGLVEAGVEDHVGMARPGQPVAGVGDHLGRPVGSADREGAT